MGIEVTATSDGPDTAVSVMSGIGVEPDVFGSRPRTDRPHSINLFATDPDPSRGNGGRSLDLLVGIGIGAVAMYYLDPGAGARRRAAVRDRIVDAVTMAPDVFEVTADDLGPWARQVVGAAVGLVGAALLGRVVKGEREGRGGAS
jgi:hypothetical protein